MARGLRDVAELLPDVVLEMVDLIGFAQTEKVIRAFGGVSFRFSDGAVYFPQLVELIGRESAVKMREYFRAEHVYIPRCEVALRALRNGQFKAEFDYLTQAEGKSGRQAMLCLCPQFGISDRLGWDIVTKSVADGSQLGLFA
ncbi:mor transcription activator family protein [Lonepinella sp. BR2271]|uniref:mor transcription activator family protein n=1 Tax=Lonepinella sp. BR2271 TaxID=3434550 RepID=UPI003F6DAD21